MAEVDAELRKTLLAPGRFRSAPLRIAEDDALRSRYMRRLIRETLPDCARQPVRLIPRVVIQFWHNVEQVPADVRDCLDSWAPLVGQGFERVFFDDRSARRFINKLFSGRHLAAFDLCRHPAMRCDFFRMCYLVALGGFYVDADEEYQGGDCEPLFGDDLLKIQPLCYDGGTDSMVDVEVFAQGDVWSPDWIYYVNNNPIIAPPGHPILQLALARATRMLVSQPVNRMDIQSTTGPGNLTASLVAHSITSEYAGAARTFSLLKDWESISVSRWPLSYRTDERNWRLWRPIQ
jgi:mannosyltransferase OCH1-like enzyme